MKKLLCNLPIYLLSTLLLLVACESAPPADRPEFFGTQSNATDGGDTGETTLLPITQRPTGAVIFQSDYCGCQNGEPITLGACTNICASQPTGATGSETLFVSTSLTTAITEAQFQNLTGWCSDEITDPNTNEVVETGASCFVRALDEGGNASDLGAPVILADNSIQFNIGGLADDQTYRISLVERISQAESTTFQIRKFSQIGDDNITGPLQKVPISRYACGIRNGGSTSTDQVSFSRFHLFFNAETRPDPLRAETIGSFFCHDLGPNAGNTPLPPTNSPLFEETTGAFTLWDRNDPRFFDRDESGELDINQILEREVSLQGSNIATPNIFAELNWLSAFDDGDIAPGQTTTTNTVNIQNANLGFYMTPFFRTADENFRSFCPKRSDFFGNVPLFTAMRETISTDTEALYVAKQVNACDFLLINESVVKRIWFYTENNRNIVPTDDTIQGRQVQFFWPADFESPFIKKGHQRTYTIRSTDEIAGTCNQNNTTIPDTPEAVRTSIPPHDKRIGCIPMLGSGQ